jgi:hypothetical protein
MTSENEKLKKNLHEKCDEESKVWVRDLNIQDVLASKIHDSKKLEKIQAIMKDPAATYNRGQIDHVPDLNILIENNRLSEEKSYLEYLLVEQEKVHKQKIQGLEQKLEIEHQRALKVACGVNLLTPPPVPPRRNPFKNTNPFINGNNH